MPSTVQVVFDAPGTIRPTPRRLHAAWSHVLDLPAAISRERARHFPALARRPAHDLGGPKPYSLGTTVQRGRHEVAVELRFLDDDLVHTLDAWLAWGGVLPIGDGGAATDHLIASDAHVVEHTAWEDIAATTGHTAWTIHLHTPTVVTSRGQHQPTLTAASLATSLHARWRAWSPSTCPVLPPRERLDTLLVTEDRTTLSPVSLSMPRSDHRGRLASRTIPARTGELRVSGRPTSVTAVFSQLMALARFTNVGSHTAYGMGVIDAIADPT